MILKRSPGLLLLITMTLGHAQNLSLKPRVSEVGNFIKAANYQSSDSQGLFKKMFDPLLVEQKEIMDDFGVRFKPADDRNIYLLYNYELCEMDASVELGVSMNYFNALSLKYTQSFSLDKLIKQR